VRPALRCEQVEERLSDHLEGGLDAGLRADVESHLASCEACGRLLEALHEVVAALRSIAVLDPPQDLAARAAAAALLRAPRRHVATPPLRLTPPTWLLATAAGVALAVTAAVVLLSRDPRGPGRFRVAERTSNAAAYLAERKDRLVEDIRILRVVIGTAFEGRLDRVNDRVDDYRRLLEKRRAAEAVRKTQGFLQNNDVRALVTALDDAVAAAQATSGVL
jgi:hypothetical protein